jgi:hypothetical protein
MTEFAVAFPVLMLALLGALEIGLLFFSVGTARYGAGEGARVAAELGTASDTDLQTVQAIMKTPVGQTVLFQISEIDIYKLIQNVDGSLSRDLSGCAGSPCLNRYDVTGALIGAVTPPWPSASRSVTNGYSDFIGVTIKYQYSWKSGALIQMPALQMDATIQARLEPRTY